MTLVVMLGPARAVNVYLIALAAAYLTAILAVLLQHHIRLPALMFLMTLPIAFTAVGFLKTDALNADEKLRPNLFTIILHLTAGLLLSAGFIISRLLN